jgi:peptidoglycan L-alanyl-D-glutamate endopeptidase CwlK
MSFKLSQRSLDKLEGVHPDMVKCVKSAIEYTKVDFGVICGMRTEAEQRELVDKGASQTMASKHLEGLAVDLMAYVGSRASWELNLYDDIADAKKASKTHARQAKALSKIEKDQRTRYKSKHKTKPKRKK